MKYKISFSALAPMLRRAVNRLNFVKSLDE